MDRNRQATPNIPRLKPGSNKENWSSMGYARPGGEAAHKILIPELVQIICWSTSSPATLACLTQVHSLFTAEAERALYHTVYLDGKTGDITCLHTLSVNSKKASFVKSLTFYYNGDGDEDRDSVATSLMALISALQNLQTITDLRIRFYLDLKDEYSEQLSQALISSSFPLHTLYCNSSIDIDAVMKTYPNLKVLGLFEWQDFPQATFEAIDLERERDPSRRTWPCFICVDEDDKPYFTTSVFAAFFDDVAAKFHTITDSIDRFDARDLQPAKDLVRGVTYYVKDFSDMSYLCDITEHTAKNFPNLRVINFLVRDGRYKFQPNERFRKALTGLTELERLRFGQWEDIASPAGYAEWTWDEQVSVAKEWRDATTSLTEVVFFGDDAVMYDPWESRWKFTQYDPLDVLWW
ncbi:hypothetical protein APHAL10511_008489 [Amanita phalloides]|nr:hypothetical protein APHAL10511_008489 [Amanita phalloides]